MKRCEICKNEGKFYKSDVFGRICICDKCVREYGGVKKTIEAFELGNIIFVK